jgi:hypothetical protein
MKPATARRAARAAYDRIPEPDCATEALGLVFFLPLLLVVIFAASALS